MYKYLISVVALLTSFSAFSTDQSITYLVAYDGEELASTKTYSVAINAEFMETVELDGGYSLEVASSTEGISTVLMSPAGEVRLVTDQSTSSALNGNFFLVCAKGGRTRRISPIPRELPSCNPT
ncbi:hypothetical protein QWI17_09595 [Gilvimarinus sp. SDUM040013]|uniref:Uncharacterized protein n=1 Tax=Gilvimarinus gilvus TaxID=3058038 RepID=A0ABU4S1K2_9GAMM|nr:hypothetical protein [Gilvimarinus sp. SDUM040013]MDO3386088.1 hypothetical protein [Gilvimarinus sp. SDUM040013]MDX6850371.1 hypothetical protein [Gilvimarinus sp. SDUM040013]